LVAAGFQCDIHSKVFKAIQLFCDWGRLIKLVFLLPAIQEGFRKTFVSSMRLRNNYLDIKKEGPVVNKIFKAFYRGKI
jgi:hypothetical protein